MESSDEKKKLNEDLVRFIRKRSVTEAPRYTARLKTYVDIQQKRRRAAAARRHTDYNDKISSATRKKGEVESFDKNDPSSENEKSLMRGQSGSRSRSREPVDKCSKRRRRRRRSCGRKRSRSCGRRRRRKRSCGRRRRRKRSCGRRRRRKRSCGRRHRSKRSCGRRRRRRRC